MSDLWLLAVVCFVAMVSPGPDFVLVTRNALRYPTPSPTQLDTANVALDIQIISETELDSAVELRGTARDNQTIAGYMQQLSRQGNYAAIILVESRQLPDGKKTFTLRASRRR